MKHINNNTTRTLTYEEHMAIIECAKILGDAFKKRVWQCNINPKQAEQSDVYGLSFAFNEVGYGNGK